MSLARRTSLTALAALPLLVVPTAARAGTTGSDSYTVYTAPATNPGDTSNDA